MASNLIITSVERLQEETTRHLKGVSGMPTIFICMNKTQKSTEELLRSSGLDVSRIFFIDCVSADHIKDDILHIPPHQLELLGTAIGAFIKEIPGKKTLVIDAISTLLIYNDENKVAKFVRLITELGSKNEVEILAFSPKTRGEELLDKIFNFFDKVEKR